MATFSDDELDDFFNELNEVVNETNWQPKPKVVNCYYCKNSVVVPKEWKLFETCESCLAALRYSYIYKVSWGDPII